MKKKYITHYEIYNKALEIEKRGGEIYHLEFGDPDVSIDEDIIKEMYIKAREGYIHYSDPRGIEEFRRAISEYIYDRINVSVNKENIIVTTGSKVGLFLILSSLVKNGDEVVTIQPAWGTYRALTYKLGVRYMPINTRIEERWIPNNDMLSEMKKMNFKMLIILNPSNPTGTIIPKKIMDEIMNIAIEKNAYVLGDEIYFDTIYEDNFKFESILKYEYKKAIGLYSLSKSHAMTGFRLGWVIANIEIAEKLRRYVQLVYTNVPVFIQYAGIKAVKNRQFVERNKKIYKEKVKIMSETLRKLDFKYVYPDAAFYIFSELPPSLKDGDYFTLNLLEEKGVAIAPGSSFGEYQNYIRLSATPKTHVILEAMRRLEEYVEERT